MLRSTNRCGTKNTAPTASQLRIGFRQSPAERDLRQRVTALINVAGMGATLALTRILKNVRRPFLANHD